MSVATCGSFCFVLLPNRLMDTEGAVRRKNRRTRAVATLQEITRETLNYTGSSLGVGPRDLLRN